MKGLVLLVICFMTSASFALAQTDIKLKIGAKLPRKYAAESDAVIATHPSQSRPFIRKTIVGAQYVIAFEEESRKIRFILTTDRNFRTANGLHVGSQIEVTREQISGGFDGWYTFAGRTPDGWDIIIIPTVDYNDWKNDETRMVTIGGFKKGGN